MRSRDNECPPYSIGEGGEPHYKIMANSVVKIIKEVTHEKPKTRSKKKRKAIIRNRYNNQTPSIQDTKGKESLT